MASDAVAYSDGGGKARAARHPIVGADKVVAFFGALRRHRTDPRWTAGRGQRTSRRPLLWFGRQYQLLTVDVRDDKIRELTRS